MNKARIEAAFEKHFSCRPDYIVRAPGRVNLIGEHTDYNGGFVLPMAINRATWIALQPRNDGLVRLHSLNKEQTVEFESGSLSIEAPRSEHWGEYAKGVAWALGQAGYPLRGWEGVMGCDIPMGAGLSSSASLELAVARAFAAVSDFEWDARRMAQLAQAAENQWVGVNCGLMDQMISAVGRRGHAVLINCRDFSAQPISIPKGVAAVVLDTATRRGLVDSEYNRRRRDCETAARELGAELLCEVSPLTLARKMTTLRPVTQRRARHVVSENHRTQQFATAMDAGEISVLGDMLNLSHASLRDDFGVSSVALDAMVDAACQSPGCIGARMTGAGFGGCAVAMVRSSVVEPFIQSVVDKYRRQMGLEPNIYPCEPVDGASVEWSAGGA